MGIITVLKQCKPVLYLCFLPTHICLDEGKRLRHESLASFHHSGVQVLCQPWIQSPAMNHSFATNTSFMKFTPSIVSSDAVIQSCGIFWHGSFVTLFSYCVWSVVSLLVGELWIEAVTSYLLRQIISRLLQWFKVIYPSISIFCNSFFATFQRQILKWMDYINRWL